MADMRTIPPALTPVDIAGFHIRPYRGEEDLPALAELMDASFVANGDTPGANVDELSVELRNLPHIDPTRDLMLGFLGDRLVARSMVEWADTADGASRYYQTWGDVHTQWRRRGVGSRLWSSAIARLTAMAESHDFGGSRYLTVPWMREGDAGGAVLAERFGYRQVRVYHHMTRPTLEDIDVSPLPAGLELRPIGQDDLPRVWSAVTEAFRDHFGAWDTGEQSYRRWVEDPSLDRSLLVVAFEGEDVAGGVHTSIVPEENEANGYLRGWTDPVYVRRPWRRRGLASALLARALVRLRDHGMTSAQLDVDTENENQALTLYERHGFETDRRASEWHKPLEVDDA